MGDKRSSEDSPSDTIQSQSSHQSRSGDSVGSTSGGQSTDSKVGRQEDYSKDNSASPLDLECTIQEERLTKILNEAIYKIKLAICLPRLIEDDTLKAELSEQSYEEVICVYEQYASDWFSPSLLNMNAVDDIRAGDFSMTNRLSPVVAHLISVLNNCPKLKPIVNEMIFQMMENQSDDIGPALEYLSLFEKFRDLFIRQLQWTAAEVLQAKIHTRRLKDSNEKLKAKIEEIGTALVKEKDEFEKTLEVRAQMIKNLEHDLQMQNFETTTKLYKNILDSERQMVVMTRAHALDKELLVEDEEHARETYNDILNNNMKEEKSLRARRFKVETQLLSWIQKYDNDMMENQVELDDFSEKFEDEERQVELLEERLAEQDKEFIPLMEEREKEYADEMTVKMNEFMKHHAARILQTAWREVLANRKEKKKLKKAVKKKKEAEEKAEKLALLKFKKEQRALALQQKKEKAAEKEAAKEARAAAKAAKAAEKAAEKEGK